MCLEVLVTETAPARLPGRDRALQGHRLSARADGEYLFVGVRGHTPAVERAEDVSLTPGDICFYDADRPPSLDLPVRARLKVFLLEHETLGLEEHVVRRVLGAPVGRSSRLGGLLSPFLSELADTVVTSPPAIGEMLTRHTVSLLTALVAERSGEDGTAAREARSPLFAPILRFVDRHLADPDLSPETIATAHHISVRYLHRLFQDEGTTVGRWIQRRRLEECRRELTHRAPGRPTIAAVAGRWGFPSAPHFSRVFRATYGMSPSEWLDTVR
ncbi:helix-turn-helix domain-containing protein [Streptomyces sp. NPDC005648]|uniref:helix-turn-helix domain-containing protein n=1 Tax=Streptomyces sp. NPDC005648 TaxID=3157044 RepID=UPI00339FFA57